MGEALFVSVVTGFLAGVGWVIKKWIERKNLINLAIKESRAESEYIESMRSIAHVYASMEALKESGHISRVFLLEISDGGSKPMVGNRMYAKSVEMKMDDFSDRERLLSRYERVKLDEQYIRMVIEAQVTGDAYVFDVEKHKDCLLKSFYIDEYVKYSEIYHIHTDKKGDKMFILSVATHEDGERFDSVRALIDTEVMQIRSYFERYRK